MKTRPTPKTKLAKLVKSVPDMYSGLPFWDVSLKPLTISEKVFYLPAFSQDLLITTSRGWQRGAEGDSNESIFGLVM